MRASWLSTLLLAIGVALSQPASAQTLPRSVLVFDQSDTNSPWGLAFRSAVRSTISQGSATPVTIYSEILELGRFNSPQYEQLLRTFLREKYRTRPIGVIVVHGSLALQVFLRLRDDLWPTVPVVFGVVDPETLAMLNLPAGITGTTTRRTLRDVVDSARALVPKLKRMVLVGSRFEKDPFRLGFAQELPELAGELEFINLQGLPIVEVEPRISALPDDAVVFYSSYYGNDAGPSYILTDVVSVLARISNRPLVSDNIFHVGLGGAGGLINLPEPIAEETAKRALRILDGESVSQIPVGTANFKMPVFDWRQLQRWNIAESSLPAGSEVRYRTLTMWEQYRWQMMAILIAVLAQAAVIGWLLFERYRRRRAETESRGRMREVIHLNRTAAAGALSASIAHELNQPLGAILSNAEAAEILLSTNPPDIAQVREILGDIRQADERAAGIIQHLRNLLKKKNETELQNFDLNDAITRAIQILSPEAARRGVALRTTGVHHALPIRAEQIHLEQVLLNLATNGMDAMDGSAPGARKMSIETALANETDVEVSVIDSGTGIPHEKLKDVFDTFYTTKQEGTGLGLSIARTIIETYGGKIWAENRSSGGAVVRFTLPLSGVHPA